MSGEPATALLPGLARQVWRLLDAEQKRQSVAVLLLSITASCLTLVGVAGIGPFFAVLADPAIIDSSPTLLGLKEALAIDSNESSLVWFGTGFVTLLILANVASFLALLSIGRFAQSVGSRLHSLLFDEYLHRGVASTQATTAPCSRRASSTTSGAPSAASSRAVSRSSRAWSASC
jgi:hypothetical protein